MTWAEVGGPYPHKDITTLVDEQGVVTRKMCCICFEYIPVADLWVDSEGQKWDACKIDGEKELS